MTFLLDFDSLAGTPTYSYSPTDRDEIEDAMDGYFAPLGIDVAQSPPATGDYSTVFFNATAAGSSDGIDFRNIDATDNAHVNARKMLEIVGIAAANQTSQQIVRASINTAMHESLHLLGARHQDAYTLPTQGLPPGSSPGNGYTPVYPGPRTATQTEKTFMSLTTLLGVTSNKLLSQDLFISPRTAMKAVLGQSVRPVAKAGGNHAPAASQVISTTDFDVPNTLPANFGLPPGVALPPGVSATNLRIVARAVVVTGSTDLGTGFVYTDYYASFLAPGRPYTIEVFSAALTHRSGWVSSDLTTAMLRPEPPSFPTVDYYGTSGYNSDSFELTDPALVDVIVPTDVPAIIVDVVTPGLAAGDYELLIYRIDFELPAEFAIPRLSIDRTNDTSLVDWLDLGRDFDLQGNDDLIVGVWTNVLVAPFYQPSVLFGRFVVADPIVSDQKFYRLRESSD